MSVGRAGKSLLVPRYWRSKKRLCSDCHFPWRKKNPFSLCNRSFLPVSPFAKKALCLAATAVGTGRIQGSLALPDRTEPLKCSPSSTCACWACYCCPPPMGVAGGEAVGVAGRWIRPTMGRARERGRGKVGFCLCTIFKTSLTLFNFSLLSVHDRELQQRCLFQHSDAYEVNFAWYFLQGCILVLLC